jgi:hypothetical protein
MAPPQSGLDHPEADPVRQKPMLENLSDALLIVNLKIAIR